jgi:hypothetical protein
MDVLMSREGKEPVATKGKYVKVLVLNKVIKNSGFITSAATGFLPHQRAE